MNDKITNLPGKPNDLNRNTRVNKVAPEKIDNICE